MEIPFFLSSSAHSPVSERESSSTGPSPIQHFDLLTSHPSHHQPHTHPQTMGNNTSHHEILFGGVPDAKRQAWVRPSTKRKPAPQKPSKPTNSTGTNDNSQTREPTPKPGVSEAPPPHSSRDRSRDRSGRSHEVKPRSGYTPSEKSRRSQLQQQHEQEGQAHLTSPLSRPDHLHPHREKSRPRLSAAEAAATRTRTQAHAQSRTAHLDANPNPHRGSNARAHAHAERYGGGERRGGRG